MAPARPSERRLVVRLSAFLSAVLLPALAAPALAAPAGIPADATPLTVTRGNDPVRAHFAAPGRVAWYKVALTKGQDYAIYGEASDASGNVITVYSPAGKSV